MLQLDPEDEVYRDRVYIMRARGGHEYAYTRAGAVPLHRILTKAPKGLDVDHINGDGLDDRKENLRVITRQQNTWNVPSSSRKTRSGYRGVTYHAFSKMWHAVIRHEGQVFSLKYHKTPEAANVARLTKEKELWGIQPRRLVDFQAAGLA